MSVSIPRQVRKFEYEVPHCDQSWTELGRPSFEDFEKKRVAVRDDLVKHVLQELETKYYCVISGPRNSGKTWLCRAIAFELKRSRKNLRFIELDGDFDSNELWTYIENCPSYFFIIENWHTISSKHLAEDFVSQIRAQQGDRKFIFTGCNTDTLSMLKNHACWISLKTGSEMAEHIKGIIQKFVDIEKVRKYVDVTDEEIEATAKKWSDGDLHDVYVRLKEGWHFNQEKKEERMRLAQIEDKDVFEAMLDPKGKMKLAYSERQAIFLPISAVCQFKYAQVWDEYLEKIDKEQPRELENDGFINRTKWQGKHFFEIEQGKASWILQAIAYKKSSEYVRKEAMKAFGDYIRQRPPNWSYVIHCARISKEPPKLVKEIPYTVTQPTIRSLISKPVADSIDEFLFSIFEDQETWKAIKEMIETRYFFSLSLLPSFSETLIVAYQQEKEQDIVQSLLRENADEMLHELTSSQIPAINDFLSFLWNRDKNRFFEVARRINVRDSKLARYKESSVQAKCELCFLVSYANISMSDLIVEDMQKQLKDGTANLIHRALPMIKNRIQRVITVEKFFEDFANDDWKRIVENTSTLSSIFRLFATDLRRDLPEASVLVAQIVISSDLAYLVHEKNADLFALRGVIEAAYKLNVDQKALTESIIRADEKTLKLFHSNGKKREISWSEEQKRLVEAAFLVGLNGIAMRAVHNSENEPLIKHKTDEAIAALFGKLAKFEDKDLKEIFCDVESINYFFYHLSWRVPDACRLILKKVGFDAWLHLFQSALRREKSGMKDAFWLLWNIFRYDEHLARKLIEQSAAILQENANKGELDFRLPLAGLLDRLEVSVNGILQTSDLEKISEILDSIKKGTAVDLTIILLSLIALKSKIPQDKFEALKENIMKDPNVTNILKSHWDTQLLSVFRKLIHDYKL